MLAWISWNSDLSEAQFNILPWPRLLIFFSLQKEMHSSEGETKKKQNSDLCLSILSLLQIRCNPLRSEPHRASEGSELQLFHGEKRPSEWVFNENTTARVSFGPNKGHLLCKGALRDCFGNKLASFSPGSRFTCIRALTEKKERKNTHKHTRHSWCWETVQLETPNNCDRCRREGPASHLSESKLNPDICC